MFEYQALVKGNFRLLTLLDDRGLKFSIETYKIEEAPPYVALSYRWGPAPYQKGRPDDRVYDVTINGHRIQISQNLHDAMGHIGRDVRRAAYMLWADAICINQTDADEKSHQVPSMKKIFEGSEAVYGWLGVPFDDETIGLAVKLMHDLNSWLAEGLKNSNYDIDVIRAAITTGHPAFPSHRTGTTWKAWLGISNMFNQEYWQRVWISQEFTTPGNIRFYCGSDHFDDFLLSVICFFGIVFSEFSEFDQHFRESIGPSSSAARINEARMSRLKGERQELLTLLSGGKRTTCTDPRDKVFAVVAHATDVIPGLYTVDYRRDVAQVYTDVVRFALDHLTESGLECLGLVFHPATEGCRPIVLEAFDPELPSWVPDWRGRAIKPSLADRSKATADGTPLYNPCPDTNVEARIHDSELELEVKGFIREELVVISMTGVWHDPDGFPSVPRAWYDEMMADGADELDEPIRRSLVGDKFHAEGATHKYNSPPAWKRGDSVDWSLFESDRYQFDQPTRNRYYNQRSDVEDVAYLRRMGRISGGQVAILPAAARLGDQVAAFCGGHCLYLVRSIPGRQDAYNFVGECYVDGLMDGAFLEGADGSAKIAKYIKLV